MHVYGIVSRETRDSTNIILQSRDGVARLSIYMTVHDCIVYYVDLQKPTRRPTQLISRSTLHITH